MTYKYEKELYVTTSNLFLYSHIHMSLKHQQKKTLGRQRKVVVIQLSNYQEYRSLYISS